MNFLQTLSLSWKTAFRQFRISLILWLVTAVISMPVFKVVHRFLREYFGMTAAGNEWLREFDTAYFLEFIRTVDVFSGVVSGIFAVMLVIYYVVTLWTTGGVIGSLGDTLNAASENHPEYRFFRRFSSHGGHLFSRYFRLSVLTFSLTGISLIPVMFGYPGMGVSFVLLVFWIILSDVTKISLSLNDTTQIFKTYLLSFRLVIKHPLWLAGQYFTALCAVMAGFALYSAADNSFTADTAFLILLMFLVQQGWVWWRSLVRVQLFGSVMISLMQWKEPNVVPAGNEVPEGQISGTAETAC